MLYFDRPCSLIEQGILLRYDVPVYFLPALIGGAIGLIGGSMANKSSAKQAAQQQNNQIAWERERALNAHQWEVKDLKAAGLNPILSAGGAGANTGSISAITPQVQNVGDAAVRGAQAFSAVDIANRQQANQDALTAADIKLKESQSAKEMAHAENLGADTAAFPARLDKLNQEIANLKAQEKNLGYQGAKILQEVQESAKRLESWYLTIQRLEADIGAANSSSARDRAMVALARAQKSFEEERTRTQYELTRKSRGEANVASHPSSVYAGSGGSFASGLTRLVIDGFEALGSHFGRSMYSPERGLGPLHDRR